MIFAGPDVLAEGNFGKELWDLWRRLFAVDP